VKCVKCELGRILTLEQKEEIRLICMSGASFVLEFSPDSTDKYPICTCCGGNWGECPNCGRNCNQMCLLSEWDENKPRDCENCSGRIIKKGETLSPPQTEQTEAQGTVSKARST
jgi:hypothetical protein